MGDTDRETRAPGTPARGAARRRAAVALLCAVIAAAIALVWAPVAGNGFLAWDDETYVTANSRVRAGLTLAGVRWAWTSAHDANWIPLSWMSHMLDVTLFGLEPGRHHLVSLALHALGALALFLVLRRITGALWRSAAVALLFALHPLRVESVAWIVERKDVLGALFWMLALGAYAAYARRRTPLRYGGALLLFAAGLAAKPMLVSLPAVLLLLDFWPLGRLRRPRGAVRPPPVIPTRELLLEKAPFLALAAAAAAVTLATQSGAGTIALEKRPAWFPLAHAAYSLGWYLRKLAWPDDLAFFYPLPPTLPPAQVAAGARLALGLTAAALRARRAAPWLATGWLWYLAALLPVSGIVPVGSHVVADRYATLPIVGVGVAVAWGAVRAAAATRRRAAAPLLAGLAGLAVVALAVLGAQTRGLIASWRSSEALFGRGIAVTEDNWMARNNLGAILVRQGRWREALPHLLEAARIKPDYASAHGNLGIVYGQLGDARRSLAEYRRALEIDPWHVETHLSLGMSYISARAWDQALREQAILARVDPEKAAHLMRFIQAARGMRERGAPGGP